MREHLRIIGKTFGRKARGGDFTAEEKLLRDEVRRIVDAAEKDIRRQRKEQGRSVPTQRAEPTRLTQNQPAPLRREPEPRRLPPPERSSEDEGPPLTAEELAEIEAFKARARRDRGE